MVKLPTILGAGLTLALLLGTAAARAEEAPAEASAKASPQKSGKKHEATGRLLYSLDAVRRAMKSPPSNLVLLTSHRGDWRDEAENTQYALQKALDQGLESLEIDVRLDYAGVPWLIHDFALDRISNGNGYLSANQSPDINGFLIKYRDGTISSRKFETFEQNLTWFANTISIYDDDQITGSFLLVDLKSPPKNDPNGDKVSGYAALKTSWMILQKVASKFPNLNQGRRNGLGRAVAFKVKGRELPEDPAQLEKDLGLVGNGTDNFYLVPVLHADDANAGNAVMANYLNKPYVLTVEPNMEYIDQPTSSAWVTQLQAAKRTIPGFPGWNEYPEGVAFASGQCCLDRNVDPTNTDASLDYSGTYVYSLQSGSNWLTADTAGDLIAILQNKNLRNTGPLFPTSPSPKAKGKGARP